MANFTAALRQEITRLARKESKAETALLKKQSAQYRRDIAALKRRVDSQAKELAFLRKQEKKRLASEPEPQEGQDVRFAPTWLKAHRDKLGFSAKDYAKLVGASELSIYMWEQGKSNPRPAQKIKLAAVRELGKREALKRLEMMEG